MKAPLFLAGLLAAAAAAGAAVAPKGPADDVVAEPSPTRRTWTASDLARLPARGVSLLGTATGDAAAASGGEPALPSPPAADTTDWTARGRALQDAIALREAQLARIAEVAESWSSFALGAPAFQAVAAQQLRELGQAREAVQGALVQARGELAMLEEQARTAGIPPGALR